MREPFFVASALFCCLLCIEVSWVSPLVNLRACPALKLSNLPYLQNTYPVLPPPPLFSKVLQSLEIGIGRSGLTLAGWLSWLEHCPDTPRLWVGSGHIQESTNEGIRKWNNKSMFFFFSLSLPSLLSLKAINKKF